MLWNPPIMYNIIMTTSLYRSIYVSLLLLYVQKSGLDCCGAAGRCVCANSVRIASRSIEQSIKVYAACS